MRKVLFIALMVALSRNILAQVPDRMSYQSVVRNSSGALVVNSNVGIKISLLQTSVTGSAVFIETHSRTTNSNGLVSLEIGGGTTVTGNFSTIQWENGPYFLKLETDPNGGTNYTISGTTQLLSVPYALYAKTSGNSNNWLSHPNGIYSSTPRIGVGTPPHINVPISVLQANSGTGQAVFEGLSDDVWHTAISLKNNPLNLRYSLILTGPNNTNAAPGTFGLFNHENSRWSFISNRITNNIGIGIPTINAPVPKSTLHVFTGDVNIEQIGSGIILKSPNGQCWRVTIDNTGNFVRTAITCP